MTKLFFLSFLIPLIGFSQPAKLKIYPFKSAIIEYKYEAAFGGTHIKYIDDYGYKQADYFYKEVVFNGAVDSQYETIILIGEKAYTINWQDSTIALGRNSTYNYYLQNPDNDGVAVNEAILKVAFGYSLAGTKMYLDKECKRWESGKSTMLTWNGLELKSEINFFMMMVEKATKIKIDKKVSSRVFEIPENLTYISSDNYQGFSGLELNFDTLNIPRDKESGIQVEFDSRSLGGSNNFKYYTSSGKEIRTRGINDYNKIDRVLIKAQQNQMTSQPIKITPSGTVIYQTASGDYGKMQLVSNEEGEVLIQYVVFDKLGFVKRHSDGTPAFLTEDFIITNNEETNKLELIPKKKPKCMGLGW